MRARPRWVLLATVLATAAVPGCGEELGRDPYVTTRVSGKVRVGTAPVNSGWVEFTPFNGAVGTLRSAPIGPDGSFSADGVAVGTNAVAVVGAPIPPVYRWRFDSLASPIRREVGPTAGRELDVDLAREYLVWQSRLVRSGDP